MRTVDAIAEWFELAEIDQYFGYAGGSIWPLLDALIDKPHIRGIQTKIEAQAVHMADAYFRLTGKLAPVLTTRGPGVLNCPGPIASAMHDSSAVMLITGSGPTHFMGKAGYQELYYHGAEDTAGVFKPITKGTFMMTRPDAVNDIFNQAYSLATSGRPGPVLIQLPLDVQAAEVEGEIQAPSTRTTHGRIGCDGETLRRIAEAVREAERPLLVAGGGVMLSRGAEELKRFVDETRIPTATTLQAKGLLSEEHPLSLGPLGRSGTNCAVDAARSADLVLAVGARLTDNHTSNWRDGKVYGWDAKIIHVDIDPVEVGRNLQVEIGAISDARVFLRDLLEVGEPLGLTSADRSAWQGKIKEFKSEWVESIQEAITAPQAPMHPARIVHDVGETMPEDGRIFIDTGDVIQYAEVYLTARSIDAFRINAGLAQMTWACGAILGALAEDRDRPAVTLTGDGAFTMASNVLTTAVENDLPGIWVILENWGLGIEKTGSEGMFGRSHPWVDFRRADTGEPYNPDFVALAEANGARGERVDDADQLRPALERAIESGRPSVIVVPTDTDVRSFFTKGIDRAYPDRWKEGYPAAGHLRIL